MDLSALTDKAGQTVQLSRFTFALIIATANRLNAGASTQFIEKFGIGVEAWRVLAIIASLKRPINAQEICQIAGMNKGAVSRTFKAMVSKRLIVLRAQEDDARLKLASLTAKGKKIHDLIIGFQLEREKAFLSALSLEEVEVFIDLLNRTRATLPDVDAAAEAYVRKHWGSPKSKA